MKALTAIRVNKKFAQKVNIILKENSLLESTVLVEKNNDSVFFPVKDFKKASKLLKEKNISFKKALKVFKHSRKKTGSLKELLKNKLSKKEIDSLISSFDSLGNIAVVEIPKELEKKEKMIANAILEMNKNFKTVAKITGKHETKYRIRPVKVIAGENNLIACYKESGCIFYFKVGEMFFSPRLSNERLRIASLIQPNEVVAVFFAGVGPFPIVFAKKSKMAKSFGIELNPKAINFFKKNVKENNVENKVIVLEGDVKKIVPEKLKGKCDRVVMPLPKGAENFLKEAVLALKNGRGIIHFYKFVSKDKLFDEAIQVIEKEFNSLGKKFKVIKKKKVRSFSPKIVQVVLDLNVL
jgi:tRNA (guanine37-N1)-methyltransferase